MIRYNVKVNDQIYQVDLERDTTIHDAESTESSADICFEAIKAEYDYCVTRAEKLENKVYILLAACAFVFALLTTQIEKAGKLDVPQSGSELLGIIIYTILLVVAVISNVGMLVMTVSLLKSVRFERLDAGLLLTEGVPDEKDTTGDAGIIVELKYVRSLHDLDQACERALEQIEDRRYDTELREDGRNDILAYGIAFCRKRCKVVVKNL